MSLYSSPALSLGPWVMFERGRVYTPPDRYVQGWNLWHLARMTCFWHSQMCLVIAKFSVGSCALSKHSHSAVRQSCNGAVITHLHQHCCGQSTAVSSCTNKKRRPECQSTADDPLANTSGTTTMRMCRSYLFVSITAAGQEWSCGCHTVGSGYARRVAR